MDTFSVLAILALCAAGAAGQTVQVNCTQFPTHTLCLNSTCTASITSAGINNTAVQNTITNLHTSLRAIVAAGLESRGNPGPQPQANSSTSLQQLTWNANLAQVAQQWANQCRFYNDLSNNRNITYSTTSNATAVGQNMFARLDWANNVPFPTQDAFVRQAMAYWYAEVSNFNSNYVQSYVYNPATRDYSQLVWNQTNQIGCGFTQWNYTNNRVARSLVCNYGPAGNVVGQPVYT